MNFTYCPKCGGKLEKGDKFCINCGTRISDYDEDKADKSSIRQKGESICYSYIDRGHVEGKTTPPPLFQKPYNDQREESGNETKIRSRSEYMYESYRGNVLKNDHRQEIYQHGCNQQKRSQKDYDSIYNKHNRSGKRAIRVIIPILIGVMVLAVGGIYIVRNTVFKKKFSKSNDDVNILPVNDMIVAETQAQTQRQTQVQNETQRQTQVMIQAQLQNESHMQTQSETQPQPQAQLQPQTIHTYEIVKSDATWEEAKEAAKVAGGHLATISNAEEQQRIVDIISQYPDIHTVWIGGYRDNGSFLWVDGTVLSNNGYSNWGEGEPNNDEGNENCLDMYKTSGQIPYSFISASSVFNQEGYNYDPSNINDGDLSTAWVEGVEGDGVGEKLELGVPSGTIITEMTIWPGYYKSAESYMNNSVPTSIQISSGDNIAYFDMTGNNLAYEENSSGYSFSFPDNFVSNGTVTVSIQGVRSGAAYSDTCISELHLYGGEGEWVWNDVPNDIASYYSGHMGYVIEYETDI